MINRELREKRRKLQLEWGFLRYNANGFENKAKWDEVIKMRERENVVYNKWKFYDGVIKAIDNIRSDTNVQRII